MQKENKKKMRGKERNIYKIVLALAVRLNPYVSLKKLECRSSAQKFCVF